jgi:hypothetical protein
MPDDFVPERSLECECPGLLAYAFKKEEKTKQ